MEHICHNVVWRHLFCSLNFDTQAMLLVFLCVRNISTCDFVVDLYVTPPKNKNKKTTKTNKQQQPKQNKNNAAIITYSCDFVVELK